MRNINRAVYDARKDCVAADAQGVNNRALRSSLTEHDNATACLSL